MKTDTPNSAKTNNSWEKILDIIWPIKREELKKFLPMSIMLTLILFVYCIVRNVKDTAIVTEHGAEMLSTVKLWGVLPFAVIFMLLYTKLANVFEREKLFYVVLSIFLGYFAAYGFVLHPLHHSLTLNLSGLKAMLPMIKFPIMMIENWSDCLFYIMAELWGSMMLALAFWQFANQITPVTEAKRFYAMFGIIGQAGMLASGEISQYIARSQRDSVANAEQVWSENLFWITVSILVAGGLLAFIYYWMNRNVLTDKRYYDPELVQQDKAKRQKKVKLSMMESMKYIFTSKYIGMIATLVISYGISINLVEAVWKSQLRLQFPLKNDYFEFMGQFQSYTAIVTVFAMILGANVIRKFSWFVGAMLTPVMILVTGVLFFVFIIMRDNLEPTFAMIGTTALMMSVILGAAQNILGKSIKYSAFDATKEMAYIPLDDELKMKGKAAVDVVGSRLGKSGGAFIQQILFAITGGLTIPFLTTELMSIFIIIMVMWVYGVFSLSTAFEKETKGQK